MHAPTLSCTGSRWELKHVSPERVSEIALGTHLSPPAARCLALRWTGEGIPGPDWLQPSIDHLLEPSTMKNMSTAVERLRKAIDTGQSLRIITDYDVDGTTSSLILQAALRICGPTLKIDYHIPNRFVEGYGFSEIAAKKAVEDGVDLIITADIGVRDHESVNVAVAGGADVLICDHHLPAGESVPENAIVLCPPQQGCSYKNPHLAACGVSFKLAQALLHDHPKYSQILHSLLKLAAIGTVADLVPLTTPENRAIVSLGLAQLNHGPHTPGLQELIRVCGIHGELNETDLGYRIGPRINAAGRLEDASLVVELLTCRDPTRARALAERIDGLNKDRQAIQRTVFDEAMQGVDVESPDPFVVVAGNEADGWHRGVVGIVASKVKDAVFRPTAIVAIQGEYAVGSVRSVDGVHAVRALDSVADLLVKYGGHPAAAGFTVPTDKLEELRTRLSIYVRENTVLSELIRIRRVDVELSPEELTWDLYGELAGLGPFGMKNPRPRLMLFDVEPKNVELKASGRLVKFRIPRRTGSWIDAIWWGAAEHIPALKSGKLKLLGQLSVHTWQGRSSLQFEVSDAMAPS